MTDFDPTDVLSDDGVPDQVRFDAAALRRVASDILGIVGCSEVEAARVADCLVEADARGLESHGLLRLPLYVAAVEAGGIVPDAPMAWVLERGATATLDAAFGFGHTAIERASDRAGQLARSNGCAVVGVRRSTHFGMAAPWVERLAERQVIALVLSNTGPSMAPYGACEPLLGTNPIAVGIPIAGRPPVVLDMSTSAGAYGRVVAAAARGTAIPQDWALAADGRPTRDAREALDGVLLPFGAHKGSGLAIVVELLAAAVPGALLSYQITDIWTDPSSRMGTGHLVIAIDPEAVAGPEVFETMATDLADRISSARPAAQHAEVHLPGDVERERSRRSHLRGVALASGTVKGVQILADRFGVTGPEPLQRTTSIRTKE